MTDNRPQIEEKKVLTLTKVEEIVLDHILSHFDTSILDKEGYEALLSIRSKLA